MLIAADYPFLDIVGTMLIFFAWVSWFWLAITVFSDLFRRHDISGWGKAGWTIMVIALPFLGVLLYLIAQGKHMAERNLKAAEGAQKQMDDYVRHVAHSNGGASDQIAKAKDLRESGAIDDQEFERLKEKALA
jgi:putative oligomerization/nucleic acid binding protein/phospholipase D-like protein